MARWAEHEGGAHTAESIATDAAVDVCIGCAAGCDRGERGSRQRGSGLPRGTGRQRRHHLRRGAGRRRSPGVAAAAGVQTAEVLRRHGRRRAADRRARRRAGECRGRPGRRAGGEAGAARPPGRARQQQVRVRPAREQRDSRPNAGDPQLRSVPARCARLAGDALAVQRRDPARSHQRASRWRTPASSTSIATSATPGCTPTCSSPRIPITP